MADRDWAASHLFLAVPQVFANARTLRRLRDRGVITEEQFKQITGANRSMKRIIGDATTARGIIRRVLAIDPQYLDEDFVNLLRLGGIISKKRAHQMRLMIRSQNALQGRVSDATILTRYKRLFGVGFSEETINLMLTLRLINKNQADFWRTTVLSSKVAAETLPRLRHANNFLHMMALLGDGLVDKRTIRAMKYAGLLDAHTANKLEAAIGMGRANWRAFSDARKVEGLAQRLAYAASGSFNHETIRFLRASGLITRKQELILRPAAQLGLLYQRRLQEKWTARRYRPKAGEAPITTFAKASKQTEVDLLHLLSRAANDAKKTAKKLDKVAAGKVGGKARSAQLKTVTAELHDQMHLLWEGNGYLTIFGEHEAARAALESQEWLQRHLLGKFDKETQFMLGYNARANIDHYVSRQENHHNLSRKVWNNIALSRGKIDQTINIALLQGKSAVELANDVSRYIKPGVPGGVQYSARRLARTELNNAFHFTTIRYTREQPWVQAYDWHLSGSHPNSKNDVCNEYAGNDHGLGVAGRWKKSEVPGKPHPNCLCYITVADIGEEEFFRLYKAGYYNRYLKENAMTTPDGQNSFLHDGIQSVFTRVGG